MTDMRTGSRPPGDRSVKQAFVKGDGDLRMGRMRERPPGTPPSLKVVPLTSWLVRDQLFPREEPIRPIRLIRPIRIASPGCQPCTGSVRPTEGCPVCFGDS